MLQVNIATREAAVAPALIDSLAEYAGTYTTKFLKGTDGQQAPQLELTIAAPSKNGAHALSVPAGNPLLITAQTPCHPTLARQHYLRSMPAFTLGSMMAQHTWIVKSPYD